jgi:CRP/FNR family transcriptional regulator
MSKPAYSDCLNCAMRSRSIFAGLTLEDISTLNIKVRDITVPAGHTLYLEGDKASHAYTLRNGGFKLIKTLADGRSQIVRLLGHGDLLGFAGMEATQYPYTAISLTETQLCQLNLADLINASQRLPKIYFAISQRWFGALRQAENRIVELGAKKAEERLATFLRQWCNAYPANSPVPFPLTRQDMGEFLGLSTEHVSRIMAEFKRHHLITEHKNILHIADSEKLMLHACASGACR